MIDANATVRLLKSVGNREYRRENGTISDAIKMLSHQAYTPTVDAVEVVHGEWIYKNGEWVCSVCEEPALYDVQVYGGGNYKDCDLVRSNYCPNCGAKMDGGSING